MKALVLRTCNEDMTSYGGFKWPESGYVECPDWDEKPECGNGLHGLLWGEGDGSLLGLGNSKWLVVEVEKWIDLGGKVKFPNGNVVHVGNQKSATDYIYNNGGQGKAIVGLSVVVGNYGIATAGDSGIATVGYRGKATAGNYGIATAGDSGTATAGNYGIATAGYRGIATVGYRGTATAGNYGIATVGYRGTATAGDSGIATAGYRGKATAGDSGTATAGDSGIATAGDSGIATAGDSGTATAGDSGTATAGDSGTAAVGENGIIQIKHWDGKRYRIVISYVGENGIEPDVFYKVKNGKLVKSNDK